MHTLIHALLASTEAIQVELEQVLRNAFGSFIPNLLSIDTEPIPDEIVNELQAWIESYVLPKIEVNSRKFLQDYEDEDPSVVTPDDTSVKHTLALFLETYLASVKILATSALADISNRIQHQLALGRSSALIKQELEGRTVGIGARIQKLEDALVKHTDSFINSASGGVLIAARVNGSFTWVVVQDNRVCVDCAARHGETATAAEWTDRGLPRTGWSVCDGFCRCLLLPVKDGATIPPVQRPRRARSV